MLSLFPDLIQLLSSTDMATLHYASANIDAIVQRTDLGLQSIFIALFFFVVVFINISSLIVLSTATQMLTTSQGIHVVVNLSRLVVTKEWDSHFQSLLSVLLSWNWTVNDVSFWTRTCCGMRKSRLLVFKWSERAHVSSAGLRPALSD